MLCLHDIVVIAGLVAHDKSAAAQASQSDAAGRAAAAYVARTSLLAARRRAQLTSGPRPHLWPLLPLLLATGILASKACALRGMHSNAPLSSLDTAGASCAQACDGVAIIALALFAVPLAFAVRMARPQRHIPRVQPSSLWARLWLRGQSVRSRCAAEDGVGSRAPQPPTPGAAQFAHLSQKVSALFPQGTQTKGRAVAEGKQRASSHIEVVLAPVATSSRSKRRTVDIEPSQEDSPRAPDSPLLRGLPNNYFAAATCEVPHSGHGMRSPGRLNQAHGDRQLADANSVSVCLPGDARFAELASKGQAAAVAHCLCRSAAQLAAQPVACAREAYGDALNGQHAWIAVNGASAVLCIAALATQGWTQVQVRCR